MKSTKASIFYKNHITKSYFTQSIFALFILFIPARTFFAQDVQVAEEKDELTSTIPIAVIGQKEPGTILWTYEILDDKISIHTQSIGGDLGPRMALGLEGTVYYAAGGGNEYLEATRLYAVNPTNGRLKWKSDPIDNTQMNGHIMIGHDGTVYIIGSMKLYAINPADGTTLWSWETPDVLKNVRTRKALMNMALLQNGNIVLSSQRQMYCITPDGEMLWANLDAQRTSYGISVGLDGNIYTILELFGQNQDPGMYVVSRDPETGKNLWTLKTDGGIGRGNNIVFDAEGNLLASFRKIGDPKNKIHRIDPMNGEIQWTSSFDSDEQGLYLGPDKSAYQYLAPPGMYDGLYRIDLENGKITWINERRAFGAIDAKNKRIQYFPSEADKYNLLFGAVDRSGNIAWQIDLPGLDPRTILISKSNIIYVASGAKGIIAIQSDAPLAKAGWPRIGGNNQNTYNAQVK